MGLLGTKAGGLLALVLLASCGRTGLFDEAQPSPPLEAREQPRFVFTGADCPATGTEADLAPLPFDELDLVRFRAVSECSGAGGEWLVGRVVGTTRDILLGAHACFFVPPELSSTAVHFAVVRYGVTAALFHGSGCVTNEEGEEPAVSDSRSIAWGVYASEADARAALARLETAE